MAIEFKKFHPDSDLGMSHREEFIKELGGDDQINRRVRNLWGTDKRRIPRQSSHWSGTDFRSRTRNLDVDYEELHSRVP